MKEQILSFLSPSCPWRDRLIFFDSIDSTNTKAKDLAKNGAPHGTVVVAAQQTGGRGRLGRSFSSPAGMGVYLSVILRPGCAPARLMHLTCSAGVAACEAIQAAASIHPKIKWTNDIVYQKKKLGGILTELSVNADTGIVDYAIVGIGINCCQQTQDFPPEIQQIATSLSMVCDHPVAPAGLAAALICSLADMDAALLGEKDRIMAQYRARCITLGQEVLLVRSEESVLGKALDLDPDGGLIVRFADGTVKTVTSGEVSVRGMYGYL